MDEDREQRHRQAVTEITCYNNMMVKIFNGFQFARFLKLALSSLKMHLKM